MDKELKGNLIGITINGEYFPCQVDNTLSIKSTKFKKRRCPRKLKKARKNWLKLIDQEDRYHYYFGW